VIKTYRQWAGSIVPNRAAARPCSSARAPLVSVEQRSHPAIVLLAPVTVAAVDSPSPYDNSARRQVLVGCLISRFEGLSTGTDSPVTLDSSTRRAADSVRSASAATRSPSANTSASPGTTSAAAISC
jgi:hypothetical protein